ncbi:putative amino acid ABC transporter substrate binding protein [Gordonia araii NBRC 100433]|uniref:Putative amino acid ABC transporter substrate binding protein n=1 Tax=Gordonia araii NBRC 100433 TaxID=1073574 RepID=G7H4S6_9ACTN|nr:ABC transporter substrate-binding protein [Gordonia araii]NNG98008.1 ABC transporter substrate-binding protein [Gordonia araii NBRC 100433]GAB10851.1 putative amino acid ABC transporter substrate binding protein [Gordonia araii NBRC 100433]
MNRVRRVGGLAVAALLAVGVIACTNDESALDTKPITVDVAAQPQIAAQLPAGVRDGGVLVVGTNPPYQPNEFKNRDGEIIGFDVDLVRALSKVLGLRVRLVESEFAKIIPAVQAGTFHVGMSAFTDTLEREKQVDFISYFSAGVQWAQRSGDAIDPDNACGKRVGVKSTTVQDTQEVPAKSAACDAAGKEPIRKIKFNSQDETVNALLLGQVDAMSADSPVTAYAIKKTDGQLEPVGPVYDAAPYGMPVAKGSGLAQPLRDAMQYLIDNGQYATIAQHWGVSAGMIRTSVINGAKE